MKNPFLDFHPDRYEQEEYPAERLVQTKQDTMALILEGYLQLVRGEISNLAWPVEHIHVVSVYNNTVRTIRGFQYDRYDIEAFCAELDRSDDIPYMIPGPAGLYISALVNHSRDNSVILRLQDYRRTFHFLGYALPVGKELVLQGDAGDFSGAGLRGGRLAVEGSAGNWCGAGMLEGEIRVSKDTGMNTGAWMHGGKIHVEGKAESIGEKRFGGHIFLDGKTIVSNEGL